MRWLPARAHDNGLFLIYSNGVGIDDDEVRTGNAMILDPYGDILVETWKAEDAMVVADLKAHLLYVYRATVDKKPPPQLVRSANDPDRRRKGHAGGAF